MENDGQPPRQKLMQFLKIVDRDSYKQGKDSPVYHFFDPLLTDDMLDILDTMKLRKKEYIDDIADQCGLPLDYSAEIWLEGWCSLASWRAIQMNTE